MFTLATNGLDVDIPIGPQTSEGKKNPCLSPAAVFSGSIGFWNVQKKNPPHGMIESHSYRILKKIITQTSRVRSPLQADSIQAVLGE